MSLVSHRVLNTVPHRRKETIRKAHGDMTYTGPKNHTFQTHIHRKKRVQYITFLLALEWESHNAIQLASNSWAQAIFLLHPPKQLEPQIYPAWRTFFFFRFDPEL